MTLLCSDNLTRSHTQAKKLVEFLRLNLLVRTYRRELHIKKGKSKAVRQSGLSLSLSLSPEVFGLECVPRPRCYVGAPNGPARRIGCSRPLPLHQMDGKMRIETG